MSNEKMIVKLKWLALLSLLLTLVAGALGQGQEYAAWSATFEPSDIRAGESGRVLVRVKIDEPWYMYGTKVYSSDNPLDTFPTSTKIELKPNDKVEQNGDIVSPKPLEKVDKNFNDLKVEYFENGSSSPFPSKSKMAFPARSNLT
jgi:hypothetical protein